MSAAGPKPSPASPASEPSTTVVLAKRGPVAWLTLNRPAVFNAYNLRMRDELYQALWAVHHDPEVGAMVLAGAGSAFCTGGDLSEFGHAPSPIVARWVRFRRDVWQLLRSLPVVSIAALHGYAVGGGLEMALLCDFAIAASDTRLSLPETGMGMIPGVAGTQTAPRRLGLGWALDLALTGRWIDANLARRIGLVAEITPPSQLDARVQRLALKLSLIPRQLSAALRCAVWEGLELPMAQALSHERQLAARVKSFT